LTTPTLMCQGCILVLLCAAFLGAKTPCTLLVFSL
jgi:hypothetical protein